MDIRNWPFDRIMQLPDCCFGRRWMISCMARSEGGAPAWDIAELAFPESMVLWELAFWSPETADITDRFRLALGDQLPTTTVMMDALEPLIPGLGLQGAEPRGIWVPYIFSASFVRLRQNIHAAGRRLVLEIDAGGTGDIGMEVGIVVSSIPTEVPDWLISGPGRSL